MTVVLTRSYLTSRGDSRYITLYNIGWTLNSALYLLYNSLRRRTTVGTPCYTIILYIITIISNNILQTTKTYFGTLPSKHKIGQMRPVWGLQSILCWHLSAMILSLSLCRSLLCTAATRSRHWICIFSPLNLSGVARYRRYWAQHLSHRAAK